MDDSKIESAFLKAIRKFGYAFPETEEELEHLREKLSKSNVELPPDIDDPMEILKRGRITELSDFNLSEDPIVQENLAQAAREGGEIPEDVKKQMENDRREAEKRKDDDSSK